MLEINRVNWSQVCTLHHSADKQQVKVELSTENAKFGLVEEIYSSVQPFPRLGAIGFSYTELHGDTETPTATVLGCH